MPEIPSIQWFPGHMKKTERMIQQSLPLVDVAVEITDARIPQSSRNPLLDRLLGTKPRVILLNKSDMADPVITREWMAYYREGGVPVLATDCRSGLGMKEFPAFVRKELAELLERRGEKWMAGKPIRAMVLGIPNVGKSSFINRMAGNKRAKVEDRPGVTRGKQWIRIDNGFDLLDMPGILWPKFEDPAVGEKLAFTGAVKDDVLDIELLAMRLLAYLSVFYPAVLTERFKLEGSEGMKDYERLEAVGRKRGMLISGGEVNTERAAITVLDEFRSGKLGRISLERPGR